jgi:hypothetical protein
MAWVKVDPAASTLPVAAPTLPVGWRQHTLMSYGVPPSDEDDTVPGIPLLALSFNASGGGLTAVTVVRQRVCAVSLWPSNVVDGTWHHGPS